MSNSSQVGSPDQQLDRVRARLRAAIRDRDEAEEALRALDDALETQLAERTRELQASQARDRQLLQARQMEGIGRLAGGIAHDFNNLLTTILGYTDMILSQAGPEPPFGRDLQRIKVGAERAATLTRQLLAFSRRQRMRIDVVGLNDVVADADQLLRRLVGEGITVEVRLESDLDSDPGRCRTASASAHESRCQCP